MRIQAALVESPGGPFTVHELDLEKPRPDEVLVRITAAGICHTDLTMRHGWPAARTPMIFGHEGAGVVEAVGDAVTTVRPGDAVCLSYRSCRACEQCRAGHPAYCLRSDLNLRGVRADGSTPHTRDGSPVYGNFFGQSSFATYALADESNTVPIPDDFPPVLAAPLGCGIQTGVGTVLTVLQPDAGSTVVVFGAGSVGLSAVMAAVAERCTVIAVDPVASRRALAFELGASGVVDPAGGTDVAAAVRELTGGGAHSAIDTTGRPDVIRQAIGSLRRRGTLALVGIGGTAEFDLMTVLSNGIRLRGVIEGDVTPADFVPRLIDLHRQGALPIETLIVEYPFADIETAARDAASGRVVKPVLVHPVSG
ncbi:NAD(P)-dependent alcohol dehydrogenase [Cryptosporangium aurantiacum]|uniref:Aryl-alcohol dehydrogenase n=1 Tax=Cryptosporangium aurantiacum TaxID=134849 RepID=A0A1M7RK10_9ACTN|nr:NAD(P)-dependent alcohol dehydrogenase [Cryptosporangium aurantiacum]SHN46499.1 aryl-alcohol dehydrogenase [Cryptosporangium aurantiacum]